ncbi:MAG: PxKF domain-containing protein [Chloroflexi bacterium]|nr:PxKF domain-containing protein [Chloroflexota bacterium]
MVSGYVAAVGSHSLTATATDNAGNVSTATLSYTVLAWNLKGFYSPVDMSTATTTIWNTVKSGSTVPLKFEIFSGTTELTDVSAITSFKVFQTATPSGSATMDEIELVTTGGTSLRYDGAGGQFIQNWQTPKNSANKAYKVVLTTADGSTITAYFLLK